MSEAAPLSRRLLAEALGSAILVATVVGSGIMADRLAGGNQAIALLGNTIPTGAILVVLITILGPISGAHFNPAVSLVFASRGELPWREVLPYIVLQCLGGIAGTITSFSDHFSGHSGRGPGRTDRCAAFYYRPADPEQRPSHQASYVAPGSAGLVL